MSSSPPQSPVTTSDEPHSCSVDSIMHICTDVPLAHATPHPDTSLSSQSLASPTPPVSSARPSTINTSSSISAIHPRIQPNPPSQNLAKISIPTNSNLSCLTLSEPATPLQRDEPVKPLSQPHDSSIVSISTKFRQPITPSFSFPGASAATITYNCVFPDSASSDCTFPTASSNDSIFTTSQRMPNVYINGLPPNCSEQDLFALTRPFGDIKSVRTFTRHVSEKPTGYGFVLYNDVESAQRCIEGLRKYRNLHPSFSKQVHRIPGTEYAQHNAAQTTDPDESTFKWRMEKLKDTSSTNLYIEGLPLSTDEESLTALMSPYKIKSSRFFKTKLSHPPRIIAFVRLETRAAAEEIIERLHGRMVRGWNDAGCRISVRFADNAEQRELRRTERTLKNGDQSPSRLTIAQAALLNLRGQELQANIRDAAAPANPHRIVNSRSDSQLGAFTPSSDSGLLPISRSLPSKLCYPFREPPLQSAPDVPVALDTMDNLFQSMQNMGYDDRSLDSTTRGSGIDSECLVTQQAHLRALASAAVLPTNPLSVALPRGHAEAHNGFTPAEELILEAHAQHLQVQTLEPMPSLRKFNSSVRPVPQGRASGLAGKTIFSQETLPTISEDDFHAMGHSPRRFVPSSREVKSLMDSYSPNIPIPSSTIFVRPPNRAVSIVAPPPNYEEPGKQPKDNPQRTERSVTTYLSSCNNRQSIQPSESKTHPPLTQAATALDDNGRNPSIISRDKNEFQHAYTYSRGDAQGYPEEKASRFHSSPATQLPSKKSPRLGSEQSSALKEGPKSPAIVSPALTYSSRTPSTLSPATPFFGSFVSGQDTFEGMMMDGEEAAEKRLKAKAADK